MKVKTYSLLILAAVMLLCLIGWTSYAQKQGPGKVRWEYKALNLLDESELNRLGAEGWELVVVIDAGDDVRRIHERVAYLKRAK